VVAHVPHQAHHQANVSTLPDTADQVLQSVTPGAVSLAAIALAVLAFRFLASPGTAVPGTAPASSQPTDPSRSRS
jgi:hypothetical protein